MNPLSNIKVWIILLFMAFTSFSAMSDIHTIHHEGINDPLKPELFPRVEIIGNRIGRLEPIFFSIDQSAVNRVEIGVPDRGRGVEDDASMPKSESNSNKDLIGKLPQQAFVPSGKALG